jgi:hypothetical protein
MDAEVVHGSLTVLSLHPPPFGAGCFFVTPARLHGFFMPAAYVLYRRRVHPARRRRLGTRWEDPGWKGWLVRLVRLAHRGSH